MNVNTYIHTYIQLRGARRLLPPLLAAPPLAQDNAPRRPSSAPRRGNRFVSRGPTWPSHANRRTTGRGVSDAPDDNAQTADPSLDPCASWLLHTGVRPSGLRSNTGPNGPGRLVSPSGTDMKLVNGPGSGVNARRPAPSARPASDTGRSFVQAREGHFYRGSYKRSYKRLDSGFAPSPLSLRLNDGR